MGEDMSASSQWVQKAKYSMIIWWILLQVGIPEQLIDTDGSKEQARSCKQIHQQYTSMDKADQEIWN